MSSLLLTAEGCNIDQTTERVQLPDEDAVRLIQQHPERRCKRCLSL